MARTNTSTGGGGGGVESLNGLTGAVTLSAGNNVTLNESGNDIEITANFTQEGKYMISGGITWSGTGLTYDVSFLQYFFNGNKTANPTQVTLDASDPTNNRFDAIVVDEAGTVTTITGTPSANPEVPAIPEDQLQVTIILVAAGSTTPTIASEEIYMDDPTTGWTFSTYQTATPTGSINFAGTSSPKQGTECIEASTDARLGARFVRATSFDAYQYSMLQVWVRFTGTAVASNKSFNVRFENSAGTLVANTVNLFNYGLQRGVLNTWQLVVVPITAFGALPTTVKGLKVIMAGGTVGVVRQWDIDYMILTNGSVPFANVPTIAFYKDDIGIASQSGINLIEGTGVTIDAVNNPLYNRVDYTINSSGGTPGGSQYDVQLNNGSSGLQGDNTFTYNPTDYNLIVGDRNGLINHTVLQLSDATSSFTVNGLKNTVPASTTTPVFTGSGADNIIADGSAYTGLGTTSYLVTIDTIPYESPSYMVAGSLDDITFSGTNSSGKSIVYSIKIINTGATDQFDWEDSDGNTGSSVNCDTSPILLSNGISISFGSITGHTIDDQWVKGYDVGSINFLYNAPGSLQFTIGETVTGVTSGATAVVGYGFHNYASLVNIVGDFEIGEDILGSTSSFQFTITGLDLNYGSTNSMGDTFSWTDGTNSGTLQPMSPRYAISIFDGATVSFITGPNHVIGDNWTFDGIAAVTTYGKMLNLDGIAGTMVMGDVDTIGNDTKITINDTAETIAFTADGNTAYSSDIPLSVKVTVPSSDILALVSGPTPYQLIPAPGAGKTIQILGSIMSVDFNTTAYDFSFSARDVYVGNESVGNGVAFSALNSSSSVINQSNNFTSDIKENEAISLFALPSVTVSQGDSDVDFYITYKIVTL